MDIEPRRSGGELMRKAGFTLIEIAVAVAILGVALTTLIGMQSRFVQQYAEEQDVTKAVLAAQYLMTTLEISGEEPEEGVKTGQLEEALSLAGYFDGDLDGSERYFWDGWTYELQVQNIAVHEEEDRLRRIDLTVRWGEESRQFRLVFFWKTPNDRSRIASRL